ncbi:anti-sigma factor domain-containing protein [Microbacterium sp. B2969]|uniref:Regulator of SigK n=1 Tax=Microbacterium alkaliflavum TaxID=3248839 RepID=A0ABW7Q3E9_9MICO
MNVHQFAELAAGHVLGSLTIYDERAFQEALAEHPEWAGIVDADAATAAALADGVAEVEPPAQVRAALLARITGAEAADEPAEDGVFHAPPLYPDIEAPPLPLLPPEVYFRPAEPAPPADEAAEAPSLTADVDAIAQPDEVPPTFRAVNEPPPSTEAIQTVARRNWTRGLLAAAASFVLLIAIGTGVAYLGDRLREPAEIRALNQIDGAADGETATVEVEGGGTATAHWSPSVGKAVLVADGLDEAGADETYQMWFVRADGAVSAGLFDTDKAGDATALLQGAVQSGDTIAVTVEPQGGSPTGQPSSTPILTIPTS